MIQTSDKGFTLVEILVTIVILGVVTVWIIPNLRRLNENQYLINASANLISVLRTAQNNSQSSVKCQLGSNKASTLWAIQINSTSYNLQCQNSDSGASPVNENSTSFTGGVTATACSVSFTGNIISSTCSTDTSGNFIITLTDIRGNTKVVAVNKGGSIGSN